MACIERLASDVNDMPRKIKPSELISALQDAIDTLAQRSVPRASANMAVEETQMMPVLNGPLRKRLRKVDIMTDPGV